MPGTTVPRHGPARIDRGDRVDASSSSGWNKTVAVAPGFDEPGPFEREGAVRDAAGEPDLMGHAAQREPQGRAAPVVLLRHGTSGNRGSSPSHTSGRRPQAAGNVRRETVRLSACSVALAAASRPLALRAMP